MTGGELTVLVLGGTTEGRELASALAGRPGLRVVSSLAGRTRSPLPVAGETRRGGFGGPEGLATWLRRHRPVVLVDATHPYAVVMSATAARAAHDTGILMVRLTRPGWVERAGDRWHRVPSAAAATELMNRLGGRPLLTTGTGGLDAFAAACASLPVLLRCAEPPTVSLPSSWRLVVARGPFGVVSEHRLRAEHHATVLVTRDSGGDDAKLVMAREAGLPVVLIARPSPNRSDPSEAAAPDVSSVDAAAAWVAARHRGPPP